MMDAAGFFSRILPLFTNAESADDEPARIAEAFLAALSGQTDGQTPDQILPEPFHGAVALIHEEFRKAANLDRGAAFESLAALMEDAGPLEPQLMAEAVWKAFYPEALYLHENPEQQIELLRSKRRVRILQPNPTPLNDPSEQMIFCSNVLLSPPVETNPSGATADIVRAAAEASREQQLYWYDHPVPIGVAPENDEMLYGLAGLDDALAFEKNRGTASPDSRLTVALSVSVTHAGLHGLARDWLRCQLAASERPLKSLDVYAFSEEDCSGIVDMLAPWIPEGTMEKALAADEESGGRNTGRSSHTERVDALRETFGVDGEYGRHYSFLKAVAALWQVLANPQLKATFKIDLDQVFPQTELCAETGKSAFEHFTSPLWGAQGLDNNTRDVELGMIAGALVNEKDISAGLFTPDIPWPASLPEFENLLFFKQRPMAVSTRAEMMTRYGHHEAPDGRTEALQRVHVTGGTNGILIDALRTHRPFTPGFVGRAEDQAYLMSVLHPDPSQPALRYVHADGLIMRHDKEAFAGDAVEAGKLGSYVGDLLRVFIFSSYAEMLPGGPSKIKEATDPFTGSFITPMPATLALLRLALHLRLPENGSEEKRMQLLALSAERLSPWVQDSSRLKREMKRRLEREREAWNHFYDALKSLENDLNRGDKQALKTRDVFLGLLQNCRITG